MVSKRTCKSLKVKGYQSADSCIYIYLSVLSRQISRQSFIYDKISLIKNRMKTQFFYASTCYFAKQANTLILK